MINQEPTREEYERSNKKLKVAVASAILILGMIILFIGIEFNNLQEENSALKEQNCILVNLINKENTLLEQAMNLPEGTFIRANYPEGCKVIP